MSQQLVKKSGSGYSNVMPKSWIDAIVDKNTGKSLAEILQGFNMYFLSYNGNTEETRKSVPQIVRKKGLWITYVKYDGNVYTEWYASDKIDDTSFGDSSNWRVGNNTLVGDISISANGNWVINGTETEFKATGEKGNTPIIRVANNKLQVSYNLGETYLDVTDNPVYTKFRWYAESENVGRVQASTDNGSTWTNMSNDFTNNLYIKKYIGADESLPTSGIPEGTIYAKGPYYDELDTNNNNPIYRLWVYAWKGNTLAWQDNGEFTSIAAGIVQETGDSTTEVMSQKAVTEKLTELGEGIYKIAHPIFEYSENRSPKLISQGYDKMLKEVHIASVNKEEDYVYFIYFNNIANGEIVEDKEIRLYKQRLDSTTFEVIMYLYPNLDTPYYARQFMSSSGDVVIADLTQYIYITGIDMSISKDSNFHLSNECFSSSLSRIVRILNNYSVPELSNQINTMPIPHENYTKFPCSWKPGFVRASGEIVGVSSDSAPYMRTDYLFIEGVKKLYIRGYINQHLSIIAFYDSKKTFISAPLNQNTGSLDFVGECEVPSNAKYVIFTSHVSRPSIVCSDGAFILSIAENRSKIIETESSLKDVLTTIFGEVKADLSSVNNSGFLNAVDGAPNSNTSWVYGVIPIGETTKKIIFNNLPVAQYSYATKNYFTDSNGKALNSSNYYAGDSILGAGLVEIPVPENAKGFLLNASSSLISTYDIKLQQSSVLSDINELANKVDSLLVVSKNQIICPNNLYAVVGEEFNLYYDSLIKGMDAGLESPKNIYIDIQCPTLQNASNGIGVRRERMWQIIGSKLTEQYIGTHPLQITAYSDEGNIIDRKEVNVVVSSASAISSQKAILCIGDSLTNNGPIVSTCAEHFSNIGGAQPVFIGQRTTSGYKHEGYPGYTFASFVNSGSANAFFIFDIPQETSVSVGDKYSTNSSTYTVVDIRTEGQDNLLRLRCTRSGSTTPSSTGALTKVSGAPTSPSSIQYSAFEAETGNPFWDAETSSVNFTKYREKMGLGSNKFDVVVIMLGTNDCIGNITDKQSSVDNAKTLISAIFSDAGAYSTKVILQLTPPDANTISSWQVYPDQAYSRKMGYWNNMWNLRKLMYEEFSKDEWKDKVYLGQAALGVDRYYGYPFTEVESSQRISSIKEVYHTNSVHPNTDGYKQLGDGYYLQLKSLLS